MSSAGFRFYTPDRLFSTQCVHIAASEILKPSYKRGMLKSLFRSPFIQTPLSVLIRSYMQLVVSTIRWRVEGEDIFKTLWDNDRGFLVACWHSRISMMPVLPGTLAKTWRKRRTAVIISLSRDGEFVARAVEKLNIEPIRGSAANKKKSKDKGGLSALRQTNAMLNEGVAVCITLDGPRGPREKAGMGAVSIAKRADVPILICGIAARPSRRLNTWDRFMLPMPFGRGHVVFDGPIAHQRDTNDETMRTEIEDRLTRATEKAEQELGLVPLTKEQISVNATESLGEAKEVAQ